MRKKFVSLLLAGSLSLTLLTGTAAALDGAQCAQALQQCGMLLGDENGDLMLSSGATRAQGLVMLLRLTGQEQEARNCTASIPFRDVPAWVRPYVAYANQKGLTYGVSNTQFGTDLPMSFDMYLAFLLRCLGYSEAAGDFTYQKVQSFAAAVGLIHEEDDAAGYAASFLREDLALYSFRALFLPMKGTPSVSLAEKMAAQGLLDVDTALKNDLFAAYYNKALAD